MELRHLRYFVAVADTLSFRKASEILHISQPPLSQQVMNLEQELGAALFIREKKRIRLTSEGVLFLARAKAILHDAAEATRQVRAVKQGVTGTLNIQFMSSAAAGTLQGHVSKFKKRHPGVTIRLSQSTVEKIIGDVRDGVIDIGFVRTPASCPKGLALIPLLKESYFVALPSGHPLTRKKTLAPKDLENEKLVVYPRHIAPGSFDDVIDVLKKGGLTPDIIQEAPEQLTIAGLVASGLGYSIVPECMTQIKIPGVVHRPLLGGKNRTGIALVVRDARGAAVENFVAMARDKGL